MGGGEADALDGSRGDGFEAFEREGEVGAAFGGDEGVNFVDDNGVDGAEGGRGCGGEEEVEGFGGGDEGVGGMAAKTGALGLGGVAGADGDFGWAEGDASVAGEGGDAQEGGAEVAFDVDGEGFEGADVDDAAAGFLWNFVERRAIEQERIQAPEKGGEGFAGARGGVGAAESFAGSFLVDCFWAMPLE